MTGIILFEKDREAFSPLSLSRHVSDLLSGYFTFSEGLRRLYDLCNVTLICPSYMEGYLKEIHLNYAINEEPSRGLYLLSSLLPEIDLKKKIPLDGCDEVFFSRGSLIAFRGDADTAHRIIDKGIIPESMPRKEIDAFFFSNIWELIEYNALSLEKNFFRGAQLGEISESVVLLSPEKIFIGANTIIEDFVVIDARSGPIHISEGVEVKSHSVISGPAYIGPGSILKPFTHILNGCSFGPQCRLSGEISKSIFTGYSNKQHYGFIGNSYVGEWVNFGAGTSNSNLKNNYSEISVSFNGVTRRTGLNFLGLLCGDHVKTAIGTLFNTGTTAGFGANVFKPGLTDKCIPSFSWGPGEKYSFDKFIATAQTAMSRREVNLTESYREMAEKLFLLS
ncbi:hypothetical protein JW890_04685 [candidate division WOR-3 bacterium]|nr:hypothetical protein [candidate division WOR-3 bacterium]